MYEEAILEFLMKNPGDHTTNEVLTKAGHRNWYRGMKELMKLRKMKKIDYRTYGGNDKFWYVIE